VLGDDITDHVAVDVGESEVMTGIAVSQSKVIQAEQVEHRRVQVMQRDLVLDGFVPELIRPTVGQPAADAAAG